MVYFQTQWGPHRHTLRTNSGQPSHNSFQLHSSHQRTIFKVNTSSTFFMSLTQGVSFKWMPDDSILLYFIAYIHYRGPLVTSLHHSTDDFRFLGHHPWIKISESFFVFCREQKVFNIFSFSHHFLLQMEPSGGNNAGFFEINIGSRKGEDIPLLSRYGCVHFCNLLCRFLPGYARKAG